MKSNIINRLEKNEFVLVAEVGVNYYDIAAKMKISDLKAAKLMVFEAKKAGAHAVKFQTYKAEKLTVQDSPSYWDTNEEQIKSQYELFKRYDSFGKDEYKEIFDYCNELNIEFLSTPFDFESADYLYDLINVYKISSSDLTNLPFIEYQAKKSKPIILSVGASNLDEIKIAVDTVRKHNNMMLTIMHCVLEYPTPYEHANLNRIITLKDKFPDLKIGYSDHTKPDANMEILKTAYNLGANIIEKHFTLDKSIKGNDHYHAMDPADIRKIISEINFINKIRGTYDIKCLDTEMVSRQNARRSIVSNKKIPKGAKITKDMLTFKRPGTGISPSEIEKVLGKVSLCDIGKDVILRYEFIK